MGCDNCTCSGEHVQHVHFGGFVVSPGPSGATGIVLDNFIDGPLFTPDDAA